MQNINKVNNIANGMVYKTVYWLNDTININNANIINLNKKFKLDIKTYFINSCLA